MTPTSKIPTNIKDSQLLKSMEGRRGIKAITRSKTHKHDSEVTAADSLERSGDPGNGHGSQSSNRGKRKTEIPLDDVDKPSVDLRRKPKGIIRWLKYLPSRIRHFYRILRPLPTPDELEKRAFMKLEKSRNKLAGLEGHKYGRLTSQKLAQLGLREYITNPGTDKPKKLKMVRWELCTRDELFTKIILRMNCKPTSLPSYVEVSRLARDPLYADELLPTLGHFVQWVSNEAGVFLTIFREGLDGLPPFVTAEDIWKKVPENKPLLTFPVGYGDNSQRVDIDLDDCPHLIIAGATKQGKSNMINQILCFWLHRGLTPQDLQLVLFDLKRGMEFCFYEGLPHLYRDSDEWYQDHKWDEVPRYITSGIVEEMKDVLPAMHRLRQIMDERLLYIKNHGHKDFNAFNRSQHIRKNRMPSLVVVFDEWARIRLTLGTEVDMLLAEMTNLARAAGMYFILGTQNPNALVLSSLIRVNFSAAIIFKCSVGASMAALGNQSALGLEEKGRAIFQFGGDEKKLQTPRIVDSLIQSVVYKAITGKDKKFSNAVDLEEILQYALDNMDGVLDIAKLFQIFREKTVRKNWLIAAMKEAEGKEFILSGTTYKVSPRGSHTARQLVRVDG